MGEEVTLADVIKAVAEYHNQHGRPPKEVHIHPMFAEQFADAVQWRKTFYAVNGLTAKPGRIDWYQDAEIPETQGFRFVA